MWLHRRRSRLAAVLIGALGLAGLSSPADADVPTPEADESVVNVRVGADRQGVQSVTPLQGVRLGLFAAATGGSAEFTCISDPDGDCNFEVPNTGVRQPNRDRRLWVRQAETGVPTGWYTNPNLRTGSSSADGTEETPYRFQTPPLKGGQTYRSGFDFMAGTTSSSNRSASGGVWQQSRDNPVAPTSCGLDVALILDLSGSVGSALPDLKGAAASFTDALVGTPSRMSLFSFSDNSPANQAGRNYPELTSVATQAGADAFKNRWATWGSDGGTNWDRGIAVAGAATDSFDVAVMITDGNPTREDDPPTGPRSFNRIYEVEAGIFSANQLKEQGTRLLVFGVGPGADGPITGLNLRAISGVVPDSDYFQRGNYEELADILRDLALGNCENSISVTKQIVPSGNTGEDVSGAVPAGPGWVFTATSTTAGLVDPPPTRTTTDNGTGTVNYPLTFPGVVAAAPVTVLETQQSGYTLVTQGGANAVCRDLSTGTTISVTNDNTNPAQPGFTVQVPRTDPVNCVVYNRAPIPRANITVEKEWVINGVGYDNGDQPDEFQAELLLTGPGTEPTSPQQWGVPREGYRIFEDAVMGETEPTLPSDLCTVDSAEVTEINGQPAAEELPYTASLDEAENVYTITNTITCEARLTLRKRVLYGTAPPTEWTLTAAAPTAPLPGFSGQTGTPETTDRPVTPDVNYQLSESGGNPNYEQVDLRTIESRSENPNSSGSMLCQEITRERELVLGYLDGLDGGVVVPLGGRVECVAANVTANLQLRKIVENRYGGTAVPADWELTATPIGENIPPGVIAQSVDGAQAFQTLDVRPGVRYRVTESGPPGYTGELACEVAEEPVPPPGNEVVLTPLDVGRCTFTNRDDPARLTLIKEVVNGETGSAVGPEDWFLSATGPVTVSGAGESPEVIDRPVPAGRYTLDEESAEVPGYTASSWVCTNRGAPLNVVDSQVEVPFAGDVECRITNTAIPAKLTLVKRVINNDGGTAGAGDWTLAAAGPTTLSGVSGSPAVTNATVRVGAYDLSETDGPSGYLASAWSCEGGTLEGARLSIAVGDDVTCTITNDDIDGTYTVRKSSDPESGTLVQPGDTIIYTVRVTKRDDADPRNLTISDDLSDVLDHASFVDGSITASTGKASRSGNKVSWSIDRLTGEATLRYSVRVDADAYEVSLRNAVTPGKGGVCEVCSTSHYTPDVPIPPFPPLPPTGGPGLWSLIAGLVLLAGGAALALVSRRGGRRIR